MQATIPEIQMPASSRFLRSLGWFLVTPLTVLILLGVGLGLLVNGYQSQHKDRIFTGVSAWGVDLSEMQRSEAQSALNNRFPYANQVAIVINDPVNGQVWQKMPAELGLSIDYEATINEAYQIGRSGDQAANLRQQFETWYYGHQIAPVVVFDEAEVDAFVSELAGIVNMPAQNAALQFDGKQADFTGSQTGYFLDVAQTRQLILQALGNLQPVNLTLPIFEIQPDLPDTSVAATQIQTIIGSPISFYLNEPLSEFDLSRTVISTEELTSWLRIEVKQRADNAMYHEVFVDENAARNWLTQFKDELYRQPENARFYFNDDTRELVLVESHVNGRDLNVEATLAEFLTMVETPNRSLPFMIDNIVPTVHSNVTAEELGITELVTDNTTWFRGSTVNRKHNIATAAARFYGIVIAPGDTFSFNQYVGDISEEDGFETGLIIFGGKTIEGVGGGVCQVSTTIFQSAFWAGFPIEERWAHGYRVPYYDDGEGAGMDATIFSPIVDLRFTNTTPYHLLIENYYNEAHESLTFKFYSTSMNRQVVKGDVSISNVVPPNADVWEFNPDLAEGEVEQVDWAVEGADYSLERTVYNEAGDLLIQDNFRSSYIPWQNVYQYGPGVEPPSSSNNEPTSSSDG